MPIPEYETAKARKFLEPPYSVGDAETFSSWIKLKFVEDDYRVLWKTARLSLLPAKEN